MYTFHTMKSWPIQLFDDYKLLTSDSIFFAAMTMSMAGITKMSIASGEGLLSDKGFTPVPTSEIFPNVNAETWIIPILAEAKNTGRDGGTLAHFLHEASIVTRQSLEKLRAALSFTANADTPTD